MIADSRVQRAILVAIMMNTVLLGVEHHQQPRWLTFILDYANFVFTLLFAFEMAAKLFAFGFVAYISNAVNAFDMLIVVLR